MNYHFTKIIAASAYDGHVRLYRKAQPLIELSNCRGALWQAQWRSTGYWRLMNKIAARGCLVRARRVRLGG